MSSVVDEGIQWFKNVFDPTVKSDGFSGFMQKRFGNGTFKNLNPTDCSPRKPSPLVVYFGLADGVQWIRTRAARAV